MDMTELEFIEERKSLFVPFIQELCMKASILDNEKMEIPTLAELILAQCTDADYRSAFVSVGKRSTSRNVDSDGMLVQVSPSQGVSQRIVPTSQCPRFLQVSK